MRRSNRYAGLVRPKTMLIGVMAVCVVSAVPARADDDEDDTGSWSDRIGESIKHTMDGMGKRVGLGKPEAPPPKEAPSGCPTITILDGTASARVMATGTAAGNQGVKYQFSLGNVGRQCSISGGRAVIRVAANGRVLVGPAGSVGRFDVPIRVVVFSEGQQKPVTSKLYKVSSSIPAGQAGAPFQFVSDAIVVPTSGNATAEYSIKVGLDAGKSGGDAPAGRKGKRRAESAAANQ